jgi:hypothetical protein
MPSSIGIHIIIYSHSLEKPAQTAENNHPNIPGGGMSLSFSDILLSKLGFMPEGGLQYHYSHSSQESINRNSHYGDG